MLRRYITVKGNYEGWHEWADAPVEVEFLRNEHRHNFKWTVTIEVGHADRALEFFMVRRQLDIDINYWLRINKWRHLGSCEMQAEKILDFAKHWYGEDRYYYVSVSEDGENDGDVEWNPDSESDW